MKTMDCGKGAPTRDCIVFELYHHQLPPIRLSRDLEFFEVTADAIRISSSLLGHGCLTFALCSFIASPADFPFLMSSATFSSASTCDPMSSNTLSTSDCGMQTTPLTSPTNMSPALITASCSSLLSRTGPLICRF